MRLEFGNELHIELRDAAKTLHYKDWVDCEDCEGHCCINCGGSELLCHSCEKPVAYTWLECVSCGVNGVYEGKRKDTWYLLAYTHNLIKK